MRAVLSSVVTACLGVMVLGVRGVAMRGVRVMGRLLVVPALVVLGGLTVVMGGLLVVLSRLVVVLCSLMSHGLVSPDAPRTRDVALLCKANLSQPHDSMVNVAVPISAVRLAPAAIKQVTGRVSTRC